MAKGEGLANPPEEFQGLVGAKGEAGEAEGCGPSQHKLSPEEFCIVREVEGAGLHFAER